eukprot:CAMPEP_0116566272 /NCGR_PEP_ID=MMETSP0397-20121206/14380_1 /TAXON_ID=216820 /ORGANISM="Cyclophora tenuis, Strain ECT3854" /LENGTH=68 /DNA_ID=CAMNT_0004093175 /DNA_START=144 /DNA_END=346 /DNA_ORIENTATION=+
MVTEQAYEEQSLRVLAATLFSLAAQQGNERAADAVLKVMDVEVSQLSIGTEEEFRNSPVVQVVEEALG